MRGLFVTFEGIDRSGKTTQARMLVAALGADAIAVREPGGTEVGERVRELLKDPRAEIGPRAEALLFMASRAQLVERVIAPALARGELVLADRFFLSTYAYQIGARGLPEEDVAAANRLATGGLVPDLTILLFLPAAEGLARASGRGGPDRMERAGEEFHQRVEHAFATFRNPAWQHRHPECGPIATVRADGSEEAVFSRLLALLTERWPETFSVDA